MLSRYFHYSQTFIKKATPIITLEIFILIPSIPTKLPTCAYYILLKFKEIV